MSSSKRLCPAIETPGTENTSSSATSTLISDDLKLKLQNIGSRVRKHVNEGYLTPNGASSRLLSKATSTQHIFRSARDTIRDVAEDGQFSHSSSPNKRPHPVADEDSEDTPMQLDENPLSRPEARPIRPLRKSHTYPSSSIPLPVTSSNEGQRAQPEDEWMPSDSFRPIVLD